MTVSSSTSQAEFQGNGVTTVFPLPFRFFDNADIVASLVDDLTGLVTPQSLGIHYTLVGAGEPEVDGTPVSALTMLVAPPADFTLLVERVMEVTQNTDIVNQGRFFAQIHENVFDRLTMLIQQANAGLSNAMSLNAGRFAWDARGFRIINVADPINPQDAATRLWTEQTVGDLISQIQGPINNAANVLYLFPDGTAHVVQDLADEVDPTLGAVGIGWRLRNVGEALDQFRYIETFGPTNTPANTKATMQAAINWCAANNVRLRAMASEYTVDLSVSSITIPSNFRCDLDGAWVKRATGNTTPHDMWINSDTVNGNSGLDIRNVRFDGQRQADGLTNATATHRFCGLRLIKCSGYLENVRADNTVNGEVQAEGTRGGIMLENCPAELVAFRLYADGTSGTGCYVLGGSPKLFYLYFKNNTGSGLSTNGNDNGEVHYAYSDGSGYSGISVNGLNMRCSYLGSKNSPLGYSGVNIGHDTNGQRATGSQVDNVFVESALGFGISVVGSQAVSGSNWHATGSAVRNIYVLNSSGLRLAQIKTRSAALADLFISGAGDHWIDGDFRGGAFNGVFATLGASVEVGANSIIAEYGSGGGTSGGLHADAGSRIICRGRVVSNTRYGAIANGASAVVNFRGALVDNNTAGDVFTAGGGVITYEATRFSNDATSGTFTITAGTSSLVVNNGNAIDAARISIQPGDAAARTAGQPVVTAVTAGTNFTASLAGNAAANATYRYVLL